MTEVDPRLHTPWTALRLGIGLMATLAGLDKFFYVLADWGSYISPVAANLIPVSPGVLMGIVGGVEIAVGLAILTAFTEIGAMVASGWLLLVAANLVLGGFLDIAVRDVVLAIAAFTLSRLAAVHAQVPSPAAQDTAPHRVLA